GARWTAALHMGLWQVRPVPQLFREHAALVRKVLYGRNEWPRIAAGGKFIMTAFSRQDWPATPNARSVKSTSVVLLSITIVIVATPARALWQIMFEYAIYHFD